VDEMAGDEYRDAVSPQQLNKASYPGLTISGPPPIKINFPKKKPTKIPVAAVPTATAANIGLMAPPAARPQNATEWKW
jgi:hypothetical protein